MDVLDHQQMPYKIFVSHMAQQHIYLLTPPALGVSYGSDRVACYLKL